MIDDVVRGGVSRLVLAGLRESLWCACFPGISGCLPLPDPVPNLDVAPASWEIPTMKVQTVDSKRRLVLPGAQPGECYAVCQSIAGRYELAKVIPVPEKPKSTPADLDALLSSAALTPKMSWEDLRKLTREP